MNSRMFSVSNSTKELAPGSLLSLLHLEPDHMFRFQADDLSDFYYGFRVSEARARRNALRVKFQWHELQHFKSYKPEFEGQQLLICLSTLAMGDSMAVEIAQQSHGNVLRHLCGAMLLHETLRYRSPIPRTDFIELLAIDDHVGLQKLKMSEFAQCPSLRDTHVFASASSAFRQVKLVQHEKKQKRNQTAGIILGADFDGLKGRVMASRPRVLLLCLIS